GVVPEGHLQQAFSFAVGSELRPGKASPWFMGSVLEAFARAGRFKDGIQGISQYWSSFLNADTTVYWELWNIPGEDVHPISGYTHEMCARTITYSSAPASYVVSHVLGVQPLKPGFADVLIAPHYAGLDYADGDAPTSKGPVHVRWDRRPSQKETEVYLAIPEDLHAQVHLPFTESEPVVAVNNEPFYSRGQFLGSPRIKNPRKAADSLQFWAKPGFYYFKSSAS
ncbi:MAG: alpha-L-rhamnosidase C-terminal domain-containing protein, partial [Terriglobia bacterium]